MMYNGEIKVIAISKDAARSHDGLRTHRRDPADYFPYGSTDLDEIGDLEISGSAENYLNESFEL
jgi:hypothetical protein